MTEIYLARHGETQENVARILQGHLPGRLTERGREQAAELRDELVQMNIRFDALLVSDLQRTIDTAQTVNAALGLPLTLCKLLRERDWGSLTGCHVRRAKAENIPADAESVEEMFTRAHRFLSFVTQSYPDKTVLCIGHGLFCRCIMAANAGCTIRDIPRMQNAEVRHISVNTALSNHPTDYSEIVSAD